MENNSTSTGGEPTGADALLARVQAKLDAQAMNELAASLHAEGRNCMMMAACARADGGLEFSKWADKWGSLMLAAARALRS